MREVVIVDGVRSPIGKFGGGLSKVRPDDLLAEVYKGLMDRTGVDPALLDDVYAGCGNQGGEDNRDVARMSTLLAGFPIEVSGREAARRGAGESQGLSPRTGGRPRPWTTGPSLPGTWGCCRSEAVRLRRR